MAGLIERQLATLAKWAKVEFKHQKADVEKALEQIRRDHDATDGRLAAAGAKLADLTKRLEKLEGAEKTRTANLVRQQTRAKGLTSPVVGCDDASNLR